MPPPGPRPACTLPHGLTTDDFTVTWQIRGAASKLAERLCGGLTSAHKIKLIATAATFALNPTGAQHCAGSGTVVLAERHP